MSRYVVDASVAVKWYVTEIHSEAAERLLDGSHELHAPDLILPEFGSIVWKKIRRGEITAAKGRQSIKAFLKLPVHRHSAAKLLEPAFEIADRTGQTVYDCLYLALAVTLNREMATADETFYKAIQKTPLAKNILWVADLP